MRNNFKILWTDMRESAYHVNDNGFATPVIDEEMVHDAGLHIDFNLVERMSRIHVPSHEDEAGLEDAADAQAELQDAADMEQRHIDESQ